MFRAIFLRDIDAVQIRACQREITGNRFQVTVCDLFGTS